MNDQTEMFSSDKHHTQDPHVKALHPLAHNVRPEAWEDFAGQSQSVMTLKKISQKNARQHFILWGPPGCGKTTLAHILSKHWCAQLYNFSAVMGGINELKKIINSIHELKCHQEANSILFIDEIHRFNKAQQDILLPYLERGDFIFLGATTQNPSIALNKAILSRVQCLQLKLLEDNDLMKILTRINLKHKLKLDQKVLKMIVHYANGDARFAINKLELINQLAENKKDSESVRNILKQDSRQYDATDERHYDVISAFIKSIRGSDPDRAILWLAVMLDGGEDPLFIARRLVIAASEDIGNADPQALVIANAALLAVKNIGMPEARIPLAQACTYLASSPKSNASYNAINEALKYIQDGATMNVPTHLRNHHPDKRYYQYPHHGDKHFIAQDYADEEQQKLKFYRPTCNGQERKIKQNLENLWEKNSQ